MTAPTLTELGIHSILLFSYNWWQVLCSSLLVCICWQCDQNTFMVQNKTMNKLFIAFVIILMPFLSNAQFGNLLKKAKNKVEQRVENKIDKGMDKKLDEVEGKETTSSNNGSTPSSTAVEQPKEEKQSIKSFTKFDFVPGERIIYAEDFSQDAIGELPLNWNSTGKGEVVTLDKETGKWLKLFQNTTYLSGSNKTFDK